MSDDLLDRAAHALREETASHAEGNQFARARVLASLHHARVRRHKRFVFMAPFGLVFAAASAWGMASGRAPELARQVAEALGLVSTSEHRASTRSSAPPPEPSVVEPAPAPPEPPPEPPPRNEPESTLATPLAPAPVSRARVRRSEPSPHPRATDALPPLDDPGHELYRTAHRAHFVERDPAHALRGWDQYLAQARGGRFALEARYNRALCLIRLTRTDAAVDALRPFARGDFGSYRRDEATRLLQALEPGASSR